MSAIMNPLVSRDSIRLAMLGMVDGNGHPYSWSAIFNGYDSDEMAKCPHRGIPDYLDKEPKDAVQIPGARVTHIWTDDPADAVHVAKASLIPNVVARPEDVIGEVDAVIVATDKGHEHVERCRPFVEAGLPVFVDKPLVDNEEDLRTFVRWVDEGRPIMSSSCMRYSKEYMPYRLSTHELGEMRYASITMRKSWERYGAHALEGIYPILGSGFVSVRNTGSMDRNIVHIKHESGADVVAAVINDMYGGFGAVTLVGTKGHVQLAFQDTFYSFKAQLASFVEYLRTGVRPFPFDETIELMKMIIAGIKSREQGGREVYLSEISAESRMTASGSSKHVSHTSGTLTQDLYDHAKIRIPGGVQLLSKRPEMWCPNQWPAYFREARGCEVWDLDGRHYYDMSTNGIGSCLLGFADPDVTRAVQQCISLGSMCSLNPPEEVDLADLLCDIHPWAGRVRFTRTGGEATAVAVRIARATTDRSLVAICGYHGWHDWYLAANLGESDSLRGHLLSGLEPLGVPRELRDTAVTFRANNREEFQSIIDKYGDRLAAVIMEPCRFHDMDPGFLEFVQDGAHKVGGLVIYDEITIGWRLRFGGSHLGFGVNPDLAVFAKALGNGHPIGAVIGTVEAMAGTESSFISSTNWTESVGPVAALATIRKMQIHDVPAHVARIGNLVVDNWRKSGDKHNLPVVLDGGHPCLAHFAFDHEQANLLKTLYVQLMLERGFLAGSAIYPTMAHTEEIISLYGQAIDEVFGEIAQSLAGGDVAERLKGPAAHTGFQRLL